MIRSTTIAAAVLLLAACTFVNAQPATQPAPQTVRCAVINGMMHTDFWPQLAERFEKQTGIKVETVAFGEKSAISTEFRKGGIDLITMHASDQIINLVADGWATDPMPWVRNDLVLVGPPNDPAGIRDMTDAADALGKLASSGAPLVVHASIGAQGVLRSIVDSAQIEFDPANVTLLFEDRQREVLRIASEKGAYTLIGRIPFRTGRIPNHGMQLMVRGDARLTRPYVVAVANPDQVPGVRFAAAKKLARFLREPHTQAWIAQFARGEYDDAPLFFPVQIAPATAPTDTLLIDGEVQTPLRLTADDLSRLPRRQITATDRNGNQVKYEGMLLRDVLKSAGAPIGPDAPRGMPARCFVTVQGADGYVATFAMAELDDAFGERSILLADRIDGKPLDGWVRIVAPEDRRGARWVRQVVRVRVERPD